MRTRGAPSTFLTSTSGTHSDFGTTDSKHSIKSDLLVWCIMPFDANDGGQAWCSCSKKESISLSLVWHDMYILEKRCTSFFRLQILKVDFVGFFPDLHVSRGRLFSWTVSLNAAMLLFSRSTTNAWCCALPVSSAVLMVCTTLAALSACCQVCRGLYLCQQRGCQVPLSHQWRFWFELGKYSAHLAFVHGGVLVPSFSLDAFRHTLLTV